MSNFIAPLMILTAFAVGGVIDLFVRRNGSVVLNVDQGRARYPGMVCSFGVVGLVMALVVIAFTALEAELWPYWPIAVLVALVLAGTGAYSIRMWTMTRWEWNADSITLALGKRITSVRWSDITHAKWLIGGWRITGPAGAVSSWYNVVGYDVMTEALIKHRPDLAHITHLRA